jgi:hypothetical protein
MAFEFPIKNAPQSRALSGIGFRGNQRAMKTKHKRWLLTFSPGEWIWVGLALVVIASLWIVALT